MNPSQTLHISADDNVVVALQMIAGGTVVDGVTVASEVPAGHKIAMRVIRAGEIVLKYGYPIGVATRDIAPGEHVHSHNLASTLREDFDPSKRAAPAAAVRAPRWKRRRSTASGAPTAASACATRSGSSTPSAA